MSSVLRILAEHPVKPWQYQSWISPRDPDFEAKATVILDLYQGFYQGKRLLPGDRILSVDAKPSIQARGRCRPTAPATRGMLRARVEHEYIRHGALALLAALDVNKHPTVPAARLRRSGKGEIRSLRRVRAVSTSATSPLSNVAGAAMSVTCGPSPVRCYRSRQSRWTRMRSTIWFASSSVISMNSFSQSPRSAETNMAAAFPDEILTERLVLPTTGLEVDAPEHAQQAARGYLDHSTIA